MFRSPLRASMRGTALAAALAASSAIGGCFVNATDEVVVAPATGSVTMRWSIAGSFDPIACDDFALADARIDLYDAGGAPISTVFVDCRAFATRIDVSAGTYSARIEMVDGARQPRSTSIPISSFTVFRGTNVNVDTDFPPDSFF
jgi:hypothetical protein